MHATRPVQLAIATAAAALLAGAVAAEPATAATVTVSGDDGNPLTLSSGATATIRTLAPTVDVVQAPGGGRYAVAIEDPSGNAAATPTACAEPERETRSRPPYRGNGVYTVAVTSHPPDDAICATPSGPPERFRFRIAGRVVVHRRSPLVLRPAGARRPAPLALPIALAPGADRHEVRFGRRLRIGRDGALHGRARAGRVDLAARAATLPFRRPGRYTVVARALRGGVATPWSRPVRVRVLAAAHVGRGAR